MKRMMFKTALLAAVVLSQVAIASADLKLKTKVTTMGHSYESTVYIKASRQRSEMMGSMVTIYQCDQSRSIMLNDRARTYLINLVEPDTSQEEQPSARTNRQPEPEPNTETRKGGTVTYVSTITDTGERKKIFGFTARHLKTTMTKEASPDACDPKPMKIETDGWYIDFEYHLDCLTGRPQTAMTSRPEKPECEDRIRFRRVGSGRLGYPLNVTTTIYSEDGKTYSTSTEVVELSTATLEDALFEIPEGYTEAKNYSELMGVPSMGDAMRGRRNQTPPAEMPAADPGSKQAGVLRVGVAGLNNKTGEAISTPGLVEKLRSSISDANVEAVALDAVSPGDAEAEAKQKECDYILYTEITSVKKPSTASKVGGILGRRAGIGGGDKYESKIDYRLVPVGSSGTPILTSSSSGKETGAVEAAVSAALDREARDVVNAVKNQK